MPVPPGRIRAGSWSGHDCAVVGGGPSLTGVDVALLVGSRFAVGINRAYVFAPEIAFFEDDRFLRFARDDDRYWHRGTMLAVHHCLSESTHDLVGDEAIDLRICSHPRHPVWSSTLDAGLAHGSNAGVSAVNLADILLDGKGTIYLLGMDCRSTAEQDTTVPLEERTRLVRSGDVRTHWTGAAPDYPTAWRTGWNVYRDYLSDWQHRVKPNCRSRIVNVVNPDLPSRLTCFPTMTLEEFGLKNEGGGRDGRGAAP